MVVELALALGWAQVLRELRRHNETRPQLDTLGPGVLVVALPRDQWFEGECPEVLYVDSAAFLHRFKYMQPYTGPH